MKYDIIVIGAGPAGLYTTRLLEKIGLNVLVIEEHPSIGKPQACSGLISRNLDQFLRIDDSWVEHKVKGAILHSHTGREIRLEKKDFAAYVVNRERFDHSLSKNLKSKILLETRAHKIYTDPKILVRTNKGVFESEILLGCDGPNSLVRDHFETKPHETAQGIIAIDNKHNTNPFVELWFDKNISSDGFVWKIPRGSSTEYGMLSSRPDFKTLEKHFRLKPGYTKTAGKIPLGIQETVFERTLLIGDSASQVKPWSGGGVIYSFTAARIAAAVLKKAFENRDFSQESLSEYETRWKAGLANYINLGMMFMEAYKILDNKTIDRLFQKASGLRGKLNDLDMDFPRMDLMGLL
jgi:geranylgeranyl reductase family protein